MPSTTESQHSSRCSGPPPIHLWYRRKPHSSDCYLGLLEIEQVECFFNQQYEAAKGNSNDQVGSVERWRYNIPLFSPAPLLDPHVKPDPTVAYEVSYPDQTFSQNSCFYGIQYENPMPDFSYADSNLLNRPNGMHDMPNLYADTPFELEYASDYDSGSQYDEEFDTTWVPFPPPSPRPRDIPTENLVNDDDYDSDVKSLPNDLRDIAPITSEVLLEGGLPDNVAEMVFDDRGLTMEQYETWQSNILYVNAEVSLLCERHSRSLEADHTEYFLESMWENAPITLQDLKMVLDERGTTIIEIDQWHSDVELVNTELRLILGAVARSHDDEDTEEDEYASSEDNESSSASSCESYITAPSPQHHQPQTRPISPDPSAFTSTEDESLVYPIHHKEWRRRMTFVICELQLHRLRRRMSELRDDLVWLGMDPELMDECLETTHW